jgi:hypothetical protein
LHRESPSAICAVRALPEPGAGTSQERLLAILLPNSVALRSTKQDGERFGAVKLALSKGLHGTGRYEAGRR